MVTDHKKIHAAASASFCVRFSIGAAMLCGALLGGAAVHAAGVDGDQQREQHQPPRHDDSHAQAQQMREVSREVQHETRFQQQPQQQPQPQNQSQAQQRQYDPRSFEARAEEQRRAMQDSNRNAEVSRRVGRMTPDERRDLRRQINEVGQDIYANPPRR